MRYKIATVVVNMTMFMILLCWILEAAWAGDVISRHDLDLAVYRGRVTHCSAHATSTAEFSECQCTAGFFESGNSCGACASGKYKPSTGNSSCVDCTDHSTSLPGARSAADCLCNKGHYLSGQICDECGSNTYKQFVGPSPCTGCPPNSVTLTTASTLLTDCKCDLGYTGSDGGDCSECGADTFKNETGSVGCFSCPEHSTTSSSSGLFTAVEACQCKPGFTGPNGGPCTACDAGKFKADVGPQACADCPANSNSLSGAEICLCEPGYEGVAGSCQACVENKFKAGSGEGPCEPCGSNAYSSAGSAECTCNPGWRGPPSECVICPPDRYCNGTGHAYPCPVNSTSALNSVSEDDCTCLRGFEKIGD